MKAEEVGFEPTRPERRQFSRLLQYHSAILPIAESGVFETHPVLPEQHP